MRKLRLIEVVAPEIVAYTKTSSGERIPDYRCPKCGFMGIALMRKHGLVEMALTSLVIWGILSLIF